VLYVRWLQAAIFSAHLRLHGIGPREPWSYGAEAEALAREALDLRERLRPYLQRVVAESAQTGLPVQRPMVLACPEDRAGWAFEDQFFFGEDLLVAPRAIGAGWMTGDRSRAVEYIGCNCRCRGSPPSSAPGAR
jgi:alpha-D-xyloside xylohydrolase